ncbi:threonine synthase [Fodinisporobacter ferrooxydans]|uniref:Threonine synthase n=1 Tax=Fodinisporobacter ferrooxydans TaxID=2901836 RepID=A0ABY4CIK6_9BACL|nr:threonine synthase [Alicyclobacillaceae bacterium MYW30-H2]
MWKGIIDEYREFMPFSKDVQAVTLQEGNTPLVYANNLSERTGLHIWLKFEGANPTGSFKDRGMTAAITKANADGANVVICASTGNTSAAAAAYAARCGMKAVVVIPSGKIAMGKLVQAVMYGAQIVSIEGNFDAALQIVRDIADHYPITLVNSVNPYRIEGQKTASFEICDALQAAPDILALPVGNAGNITAYWKGFKEYYEHGKSDRLPRMFGFEAEGSAAIVRGEPIPNPETLATAIRIGNPASWQGAVQARDESGGVIDSVTDDQILEAYRLIGREGIFCEPASAASVAGVLKMYEQGKIEQGSRIVCVLTGNGLKDPDTAMRFATDGLITKLPADRDAVVEAIYGGSVSGVGR